MALLFSQAQQFGGFPARLRWRQIGTDTARVLFAPPATAQAQRVAAILHRMAAIENTLGNRLRKINVVLHHNTTLANGYVALGPFRSEFYLVPGSNLFEFGNLPWAEQLGIHEYRHVQQYNQFNRGLSAVAGVLLGQEGRALANAAAIPDWFFEGDAVHAETIYSPQGRGRQPYFFNSFRALWRQDRKYSWMKLRNGSLKDQVPNHYPLGYLLVNYGHQKYGADFWRKVTRDASAFRGLFYPFQQAVRRHGGQSFRSFREEALAAYARQESRRRDDLQQRQVVTHRLFPRRLSGDRMIYLKESYQSIPAFYLKKQGRERRIALRDISSEDWMNYRNGTIAYTAYSTHPRWSLIDYSDIMLLDVASGQKQRITRRQKYFTPALSPDDSTLVAVHYADSLVSELHVLNRQGQVLQRRRTPAGALFVHPQYLDERTVVVGVRHPNARMSLQLLDLATLKFSLLLPATNATIGFFYPDQASRKIYFTASLNGTDDLYELEPDGGTLNRLTTGGVGHYFPSVDSGRIAWSEFTISGFQVREQELRSFRREPVTLSQLVEGLPPFEVAGSDSAQNLLETATANYPVKPYRRTTGLLNFHSWRPYYEDPEFTFSLYSDNVLNTFSNELYYRYNQNENGHTAGFATSYGGFYPVLRAGVEHTFTRTVPTRIGPVDLQQTEFRVGYYLPFNLTKGVTYRNLRFGSDYIYNRTRGAGSDKDRVIPFNTSYLSHQISWVQQLPMARQQIFPRFAYSLNGNLRHRLDNEGYQALGTASLFLPGAHRTHSLVLQGSVQQVDTNNLRTGFFANRFAGSRGYFDYFNSRMWRLSGNYHFPVLHPDAGFANIVYLLRLRANAFADLTRYFSNDKLRSIDLRSAGAEVFFDTKWWNQQPVSFGFRYCYLIDADRVRAGSPHVFEFVLPLNLIPR